MAASLSRDDALFLSHKHGACADSFHDFSHGKSSFNTKRDADKNKPGLYEVLKGLPESANKTLNGIPKTRDEKSLDGDMLRKEATMLNEIFSGQTINGLSISDPLGKERGNIVKKLIEAMRKGTRGTVVTKPTGEVDWDSIQPGTDSFNNVALNLNTLEGVSTGYTVKILHKTLANGKIEGNVKQIQCHLTSDDYVNFFGTNEINLLFDAAVINVTNIIRNCKPGVPGKAPLYLKRVVNRELINDPAPKTYFEPPTTGKLDNNVNFDIVFEDNYEDITYSKHTDALSSGTDFQRDKFFSSFDFRLSHMTRFTDAKGDTRLPKTTVDIIGSDGKRIYNNDNPHENNNIAKCWARIMQTFKASAIKHIEAAAYFQCKRSGDWFQALSCLDMGRKYVGSGASSVLPGNKIVLVTHDRVLLWYALFLGIDVLMTYKVAADDSAEEEEEEEEELTTGTACQGGSERYMIYFSSNKRGETEEERNLRLFETLQEQLAQDPGLSIIKDWIVNYNSWLAEIKAERIADIENIYQECMAQPRVQSSAFGSASNRLIQAYFQYTALDYDEMSTKKLDNNLTTYKDAVQAATNKKGKIILTEEIAGYANIVLSYYNNMLYKSVSIPNKESLVNANTAYKHNELYTNPVAIGTVIGGPSRARVTLNGVVTMSPSARATATAGFFVSRLPNALLKRLVEQMTELKSTKLTFTCVLDVFLPNLMTGLSTQKETSEQITAQLQQDGLVGKELKAAVKKVIEDVTVVVQQEQEAIDVAVASAATAVAATVAESKAQLALENTALPDTVALPNGAVAVRQEIFTMASIGDSVRRFGHYIRGMVLRGRTGYGVQGGGGGPDTVVSKLLYTLYLRQLYNDLSAFDTDENQDYIYYDALARMVLACSARSELRVPNYYGRMEHLFYDVLPNGGWAMAEEAAGSKFIRSERFANTVAFIAKNVALQSIDLATGDINSLGNSGDVSVGAVQVYNDLKVKLRGVDFDRRQAFLLNELQARMLSYIPQEQGIGLPGLASIAMRTGVGSAPVPSVGLPGFVANARQAVSAPAGGRRTRRRRVYGGQRKTRRHGRSRR